MDTYEGKVSGTGRSPNQPWHILVRPREPSLDGHGSAILSDIRQLGLEHVEAVRSSKIYMLVGSLTENDVRALAESLFADAVAEVWTCGPGFSTRDEAHPAVEVHPLPGVMNPVALSALAACKRVLAGITGTNAILEQVQTARRYEIIGARCAADLDRIARRILANDCIETWYIHAPDRSDPIPERMPTPPQRPFELKTVPIRSHTPDELTALSRSGHLFLSLEEMQTIQSHFRTLQRDPTDLELETLAQTWSEHCVHKTLKAAFDYTGDGFGEPGEIEAHFGNLLKETIAAATKELGRDWCLSVFVDNAGVVALDDEYGIAFKAETHNHPSAIEPYGGAATGIGGCIRDIMGCGLGAKPIASTDVFCVAPPDYEESRLPKDVLHPRRVLKGIVGGVRDYGNRMGIPTVNGAIYFDDRYLANPLVFCGCIGLIPRDRIHKAASPGDLIVVAGGRTGRDGIHGATFSSAELTDTASDEFSHAVQIGNAVEEKKVLDAMLRARDHERGCLYSSVTDCGAGGLSSAVGEMGEPCGADVDLKDVPLKYAGLRYDEIWISEAQERMVFAVPPEHLARFLAIFEEEEVEATVIGRFTGDNTLTVRYDGQTVGSLDMAFLHNGLPRATRRAHWTAPPAAAKPVGADAASDLSTTTDDLLSKLADLNVCSRQWVIHQYDHEVQGRSVVKPLTGRHLGPSDAAVMRPRYDSDCGIAIGCGLCPEEADPYWMAILAVDEAFRNVICVGADPNRTAILDNFCWPKADPESSLGALVRACKGAYDAAMAFGLPFVSGKDSLNNEFTMDPQEARRVGLPPSLAIPYTLLISALGRVEHIRSVVTMDLKRPGHVLAVASAPVRTMGLKKAAELHARVARLIARGAVAAAHDVSDGGLAVAAAEMILAAGLGATITLSSEDCPYSIYAEPATTYLLEMTRAEATQAELVIIGEVVPSTTLTIDRDGKRIVDTEIAALARAWRSTLAFDGGSGHG
ncbi:MAG: phosphoribosylformylglycinamidine synthase subunit PurS [Phycisphaerae bacterium]